MTYILGSRCKDGVVLISDRKIIFDGFNLEYRDKLFIDFYPIVMGAAGSVSLFDKFRVSALSTANDLIKGGSGDQPIVTETYVTEIETITGELNRRYKLVQDPFEVLIAAQTQDRGAILYHVYPEGFAEIVPKYRAIGHGEPFGSIFLKNLWRPDLNMIQVAQIGYFIINCIEKSELDTSVGVGINKPQIWFIPDTGELREANDVVINRFEVKTINWMKKLNQYFATGFDPEVNLEEYVVITKWGSYCNTLNGNGCDKSGPGALIPGDGQFDLPEGISLNSTGHVYVVEQGNNRIQKFDSNGNFITKWGARGTGNGQFVTAFAIAIDSKDNVYVSDDGGRIQKFDIDGKFITKWGTYGSGNSQFSSPHGMCIDSNDNVYVSDETNNVIQKFDNNGKFITKWGAFGEIQTSQHSSHSENLSNNSTNGRFNHPMGIVADAENNIYVADHLNHRIQKFDNQGNFITKWGTYGDKDGQFDRPHGIAIDMNRTLFITDSLNNRIQKFTLTGQFISKWGSKGAAIGQLNTPRDLVVSPSNRVFVSDGANHRIQVFASAF